MKKAILLVSLLCCCAGSLQAQAFSLPTVERIKVIKTVVGHYYSDGDFQGFHAMNARVVKKVQGSKRIIDGLRIELKVTPRSCVSFDMWDNSLIRKRLTRVPFQKEKVNTINATRVELVALPRQFKREFGYCGGHDSKTYSFDFTPEYDYPVEYIFFPTLKNTDDLKTREFTGRLGYKLTLDLYDQQILKVEPFQETDFKLRFEN